MTRETALRKRLVEGYPDLIVDLHLYAETNGGRTKPIGLGWGCPCSKDKNLVKGWDGYPLLDREMLPGERRRVGFVFLSGREAVEALAASDPIHLWEGKFIGEALTVR